MTSSAHSLEAFFNAKTVALIGASETKNGVGCSLAKNLQSFPGKTYLVNPNRETVLGEKCWPDLTRIPEKIDLALIATPALTVPGVIRQCVQAETRAAIIISAGFRECGKAGRALEAQVLAEARQGKLRLLGPNCLGLMAPHIQLNASFASGQARPGSVAFLSQSGALCSAVLDWSAHDNVGFSAFVSLGSMLDVGWEDLIGYFRDDPHTKSIVCYMESVGDARGFLAAARETTLTKPIIVLKVGHTEAGAKAAASHTGAMTGCDEVYTAAFRQAGVLRVETIEELFDMAEVLSKQPRPHGPQLGIVTNAGGPGALAADQLVSRGGQIPQLSPETLQRLNRSLPPHWNQGNPIDVLGDADPQRYSIAVEAALQDPNTDGVLAILTPQAMTDSTGIAASLGKLSLIYRKPLLASWMGAASVEAGEQLLNDAGIPTFPYPDRAARAFALMWRHSDQLKAVAEPSLTVAEPPAASPKDARRILQGASRAGRRILTEVESKEILGLYGINTLVTKVALSEEEAIKQAEYVGYPVVLKLLSETLTHKSDVGGVALDLYDAAAVEHAWRSIQSSVTQKAGREHFLGVTVQPMVKRQGYELILGASMDPQFGPVVLFGVGGRLAEIVKDTAFALAPLTRALAVQMMKHTRIHTALKGVRGGRPVDVEALADLVVRFSRIMEEQPQIAEIEINPLLASADEIVALDARIILQK